MINHNFQKLQSSYLFSDIARKVKAYKSQHPDKKVISLGIGDVTQPLPAASIQAMHKAVDEMSQASTFRGYGPEQGYEFLRQAIITNDYTPRGDYTFPEIVSQVRHFMKLHINRQELQAAFTGNVRFTENFFLRLIPVVFKNPVMALNYRLHGVRPYSCTYTNPGAFTVPPEMAEHIRGAEVILGQATVPRCHCAPERIGH